MSRQLFKNQFYEIKKALIAFLCLPIFFIAKAQNTDLPNPASNFNTVPAGSYVIAMDNSFQSNSSGNFNLKAYGLIIHLLNNNVRIRWSIKAGKAKDDIDFSASADQIKPTLTTGGTVLNFKAGPFLIFAADTTGVASLIDAFYTANALTGTNRPQVYRLTANALNVDIRYDLGGFRPKAAVLTDGGNQNIHLAYMAACAVPTENYTTSQGTDLISNCFTFASEPHNNKTGTAVNNAINAIKEFVSKGGNFLAQCEAISNYENNSLGRFQTTSGVSISNTSIGTSLMYGNPDLSFSQFDGAYNASSGGSLKNWKILGSPANNLHGHATGTSTNIDIIGASVSKHYYAKGGLVFYIGNHSFGTTSPDGINGIRMYMNAFLTPSNTNCPSFVFYVLPLRLLSFSINTINNHPALNWKISGNEEVRRFTIERSGDGTNFSLSTVVAPTKNNGEENYILSNIPFNSSNFYRLKIEDQQGRTVFSPVVQYNLIKKEGQLTVLTNPIKDDLLIGYNAEKNTKLTISLFHSSGAIQYQQTFTCVQGNNIICIPPVHTKQSGVYFLNTIDSEGNKQTINAMRF